ncbi:MAG: 16S rRNA (uracil(1498)-N(3))-methyltransferase [Thermoguttaceae bacterium]
MGDRYFVDDPVTTDHVTLAGTEAHHLVHVMRATPGDQVTLFDGSGDEFSAVVDRVGRADIRLAIVSRQRVDRELPFALTLAVALPKGERQKWLVEKAVELGITRIVPLRTSRAVADAGQQARARLGRAVIEASKQCGRNRLMAIDPPRAWEELVAETLGQPCRLLAHPGAGGNPTAASIQSGADVLAAVGPEGGFTDEEVQLAIASGWRAIDLGPRILRIETAAIALATVISQCTRQSSPS